MTKNVPSATVKFEHCTALGWPNDLYQSFRDLTPGACPTR